MDPNQDTAAPSAEPIESQVSTPAAEPTSTAPQETAAPAADAKQEATPISSGAGDKDANKKPSSLLDAVKSAAAKKVDAASSTVGTDGATAPGDKAKPEASLDDAAKDQQKPEQTEKLPFHNHPRWKEVQSELKALKPEAEQFRKITTFMSSNGLSTEEVAEGFQIMALMKTNPAEAHKRISEYKSRLDALVGETLPEDISRKVDEGYIDPDSAKQLAAYKAREQLAEARQAEAVQYQAQQARSNVHAAVVNWEQQMKVKDADWSAKKELVIDQVKLMLATEQPNTAEEALTLVERAYSKITDQLKRFAPRRQPAVPMTSASSSANAVVQPRNMLEAIRAGIAASR